VPIDKAQLKIADNDDPAGDERFEARGMVTVATTIPAIDPSDRGLAFEVTDAAGVALFRQVVPGVPANDSHSPGWKRKRVTNRRWQFRDATGTLAGGISQVSVTMLGGTPANRFKFKIKGKGAFQVPVTALPLQLVVVFGGDQQLADGQCGRRAFDVDGGSKPRCAATRGGAAITCR
jgi:hypothetical protein